MKASAELISALIKAESAHKAADKVQTGKANTSTKRLALATSKADTAYRDELSLLKRRLDMLIVNGEINIDVLDSVFKE